MKILNWYVTRGFLVAFFMAIGVLTFGMTGANLVKVLDYVSHGIPFITFLKFTIYIMPIILTFTVPWAVRVAVMIRVDFLWKKLTAAKVSYMAWMKMPAATGGTT